MQEILQNPDQNRILHISCPNKDAENLLFCLNEYILFCRKTQATADERDKELRAQIENISHDLRTPLTAILGYLELIDDEKLSAEDREALEIVVRKSRSLQRLIGNFYDLSRLELEDYQLSMERVEVTRFVKEIMISHYQQLENRGLEVELELPNTPIYIQADTGALERICTNLIQNALRYAVSRFHVSIFTEDGSVKLVFENDTDSVGEADVKHLFERFYVKNSSRTAQSTGLGLTISKLLAEAMNGSAGAELNGNMLRFVFTFYFGGPMIE